ncbi:TadE/TadG family type IV pilus assembly protein [Mariniluteicoccus flavus]
MRRDERGAASVEALVLVPVLLLVVACLVAGARVWFARSVVADAAHAGARAATLERSAPAAGVRARAVVAESLRTQGMRCADQHVQVDVGGFAAAVGQPARVRVDVSCRVPLGDLVGLAVPGKIDARGSGVSALDSFRERR